MKPLASYQLDRLRLLSTQARAYTYRDSIMPVLEHRGLAVPTGRYDTIRQRREWMITEQGRALLAELGNDGAVT